MDAWGAWLRRLASTLRHALSPSLLATVALTCFNVLVHGPRHLLLHLGAHAWLRLLPLRVMVYLLMLPLTLLLVVMFGYIWLTYQPVDVAQMTAVSGMVVSYGRDDLHRLVIVLDEYRNGFIPHAAAAARFDAARFSRDVRPGDRLHLLIHTERRTDLNTHTLIAAYEIRSDKTTFLSFAAATAAEQHDRIMVLPRLMGLLSVVSMTCTGLLGWEAWRVKRYPVR
jgi:hypothetical protein